VWRSILILAAIWIGFEYAISWAAFCHPDYEQAASNQAYPEYCAFRGPLLSVVSWASGRAITVLHNRDKEIVAAFTVILALSTIFLWIATRDAARAARRQIGLARDEFISTHRPKLIVRQFQLDAPQPDHIIKVHFSVINAGDTEATLRLIAAEVAL
jgi:hypothetical protein